MDERPNPFPYNSAVTNVGAAVLLAFGSAASFPAPESYSTIEVVQPISQQVRSWEGVEMSQGTASVRSVLEPEVVLSLFAKQIAGETVDPPPEIDTFITEHFWELV